MDSFLLMVRRWLLVAASLWFLVLVYGITASPAHAQSVTYSCTDERADVWTCPSKTAAEAITRKAAEGRCKWYWGGPNSGTFTYYQYGANWVRAYASCSDLGVNTESGVAYWQACPAGTTEIDGTCQAGCDGGAVRMTNGMCSPKPEECTARNAEPGFINVGQTTRNFSSSCIGGCEFKVAGPNTSTEHGGQRFVTGEFEFSGNVCGQSPQSPPLSDSTVKPDKPQECTQAGTQTFCVKANGDHCVKASAGKQICFKPGETGEKTDGPKLVKQNAGDQALPPKTPPPEGDTFVPDPQPITKTSTFTNSQGQTTTITTTINTHTTQNGTNAGKTDQGQKDDGTGEEGGDGDGEKGGFSKDCNSPPSCSQTDGIGCAMVRQQWSNYCEAFKGDINAIGNTDQLPKEGLDKSLLDIWDQGDGYIPGPQDIDTSGWAGRGSCPIMLNFSIAGRTYNIDHPQLCEILDALAALILIVGSWHAGFIVSTGHRKG